MRRAAVFFGTVALLAGQTSIFPLKDVKPDQQAVGRTVFRGTQAEEFPVQILGVLRASGPDQNLILAKLLTPRLEQTGVMQGMSGSPVFIDGKLVGAIAFAFPFAKEPIAGIRPIEEMLGAANTRSRPSAAAAGIHLGLQDVLAGLNRSAGEGAAKEVLTPISFSGMTAQALSYFGEFWKRLGFALQDGVAGSNPGQQSGPIRAGDMISVQLMRGDLSAGADGTVTHRDGNRILAFGHRFLSGGEVDFPFSQAEVLTPLPTFNTSFKISQALAPAGAIISDGDVGIVGELGRQPRLTPVELRIDGIAPEKSYRAEMVRHNLLSPLLLQMALFSALDHHMRSAGPATVELDAEVDFGPRLPALKIRGRYAGDANLPLAASLSTALPLAFLGAQAGETLIPEAVRVKATAKADRDQWVIEGMRLSRRSAKAGDPVEVQIQLVAGEKRLTLKQEFQVPNWLSGGQSLTVSAQDSFTANLLDFRAFYQPGGPVFSSQGELIETLNRLHPAGNLYLRVLRSGASYGSGVSELDNLPHSVAGLMSRQPGQYPAMLQSRVLDREFEAPSGVVSGSKTATLEIEK